MKFQNTKNGLVLTNCKNFDPFVSCECGQCFRFAKIDDDEYELFAKGRALDIKRVENGWLFKDIEEEEFKKDFFDYFDLSRDYGEIISSYKDDKHLILASDYGSGIRIFRQDPWETLVSFIISQNNNIPRIKKIINSLCELLGEEKNGFFSFPSAEAIKNESAFGFQRPDNDASYANMKQRVTDEIERVFRPEFINRIDEIVFFNPLGKDVMAGIVKIQLRGLEKRLAERHIELNITDKAIKWLGDNGYDAVFGARPLKRLITSALEDKIADLILSGSIGEGSTVYIDVKGKELTVG